MIKKDKLLFEKARLIAGYKTGLARCADKVSRLEKKVKMLEKENKKIRLELGKKWSK